MIRTAAFATLSLASLAGCAMQPRPAAPVAANAPVAEHALMNNGGAPAAAPAPVAVPGNVYIYRGVRRIGATTNIDWSNASFGVSGNPATLSFFDAMGGNQECWLRVTVHAPNVPVVAGQGGTVTLSPPAAAPALPAPGPNPSPWAATFDNVPAGHWSITKVTIGSAANGSNASSGTYAGAVFKASTIAGQVTIIDGTVAGCQV